MADNMDLNEKQGVAAVDLQTAGVEVVATPVERADTADVTVDVAAGSDVTENNRPEATPVNSTIQSPMHQSENPVATRATRRTNRESIREFVREPRQMLQRLRPQTTNPLAAATLHRSSFRRKVLRTTNVHARRESHLKLGSFRSQQVSTLVFMAKLIMSLGPFLQLIWTIFIEPDSPAPVSTKTFNVSMGDRAEATIQLFIVVIGCLFVRRIITYDKRQPLQFVLANLVAFAAIVGAITFSADLLKSYRPNAGQGRRLLSFANAMLASFVYITLSYLTDHFAETILSSREAFQHVRQERLLQRSRRLSSALNISCGFYLAIRLALTWRSDVVFDFLPGANIITPLRVKFIEGKGIQEPHVFTDAVIVSVFDGALCVLAFAKCYFTQRLFSHIFISDFAWRYTEFRIFVVGFRNTLVSITLSGHIAAWTVPFYHTIDPAHLNKAILPVVNIGSVQMQLGFRMSLALWLLSTVYCALPTDSRGLVGLISGSRKQKVLDVRVKYFLSQAEALQKTAYRNLLHVGHADPSEFIMEHQVEAFNFAQLVYARGNKNYDQELESLGALVGDPAYEIVDAIHDVATDTHCLIVVSDAKIVVTFRGTSSKKNARTDLQSAMTLHLVAKQLDLTKVPSLRPHPKPFEAGKRTRTLWHKLLCKRNDPKVHSGFYGAYLAVAERVLDRVHSLYTCESRPILVTGHSLGGALAVLCAFDIVARQKISNVACTTFGCPRIGNHAFQKRFSQVVPATFAFVNASDMITKLPPKTPKAQSYSSVGKIVLINAFGNLIIEPNMLELDVMHRGYSPKAHTMRAYQLSLLLWCRRSHATFHPQFWRQSLAFLQAEYGHLPDVREYLKSSMLLNPHMRVSIPSLTLSGDSSEKPFKSTAATRAQLRTIANRLETALEQERDDREDEVIALSLIAQLRQWLSRSNPREWFSTDDALRLLVAEFQLPTEATALDLAQLLTVQGLLKPERVVFTRNARFYFPVMDEEEDDDAGEVNTGEENNRLR